VCKFKSDLLFLLNKKYNIIWINGLVHAFSWFLALELCFKVLKIDENYAQLCGNILLGMVSKNYMKNIIFVLGINVIFSIL